MVKPTLVHTSTIIPVSGKWLNPLSVCLGKYLK